MPEISLIPIILRGWVARNADGTLHLLGGSEEPNFDPEHGQWGCILDGDIDITREASEAYKNLTCLDDPIEVNITITVN